jgi:acyl dehydratase
MPRVHSAREERFGGYLEDYEPGEVFRHWPGKTVTEAEDHIFCLLTMAASPLHVDRHYAATETEFGKNIVVGTFV